MVSGWSKCTAFIVHFISVVSLLYSSDSKASAYNAGDPGSVPGLGRSPGEGNGNALQYSCLEKSHGRRSLVGNSPWSLEEMDTTERLSFFLISTIISVIYNEIIIQLLLAIH